MTNLRKVEDVSDEEFVGWFVSQGMSGIETSFNLWIRMGNDLGVRTNDMPSDEQEAIEEHLASRVYEMIEFANTPLVWLHDEWIGVAFAEWGRRLEGCTAEAITKMLEGVP